MKIEDARVMAIGLMKEHGLVPGWNLKWLEAKGKNGHCHRYPTGGGQIGLSRPNTLERTDFQVRQTVLHEIAHALVNSRALGEKPHGHSWLAKAREIGYVGGVHGAADPAVAAEAPARNTLTYTPLEEIPFVYPGDTVQIKAKYRKPGQAFGPFMLVKINPKNWKVEDEQGATWTGDARLYEKSDLPFTAAVKEKPAVTAGSFVLGEVVTTTLPQAVRTHGVDAKYAVIALRADRVNVAKLGGEGNRYWKISPELVHKVTL